jgi:lipoyl(octanoyl) transferase
MEKVIFQDLGQISYEKAWEYQRQLHQQVVDIKMQNRDRVARGEPLLPQQHFLLFCEHHHVYTLGKSGSLENLLLSEAALNEQGIEFFKINRGGDITYHGPQQIVAYPILDLEYFFTDVHRYVRYLEEAVILTLAEYGIKGERIEGYTGVWIFPDDDSPKRKICAIGVHLSRWVTMHGLAFNINTDLTYFDYIIPCGIQEADKTVTSLAKELGRPIDLTEVKRVLKKHFQALFDFNFA